jgi:hypothetical protein
MGAREIGKWLVGCGSATLIAAFATVAVAETKQGKPVVCLSWFEAALPVDGQVQPVVICTDTKKPVVLVRPRFFDVKDANGEPLRIAVGWRN